MQEEYVEGDQQLFPWIKVGPPIRVKEISYEYLTQTVTIQDPKKPPPKKHPKLVSINRVANWTN
jgi:hypothetical protein